MTYPDKKKRELVKKNPDLVGIGAYAKMKGISRMTVNRKIKTGEIIQESNQLISIKRNTPSKEEENIDLQLKKANIRIKLADAEKKERENMQKSGELISSGIVGYAFRNLWEQLENRLIKENNSALLDMKGKKYNVQKKILDDRVKKTLSSVYSSFKKRAFEARTIDELFDIESKENKK